MYLFENRGDSVNSDLTYLTDTYLPGNTFGFNHAALADLDAAVSPLEGVLEAPAAAAASTRDEGSPTRSRLLFSTRNWSVSSFSTFWAKVV